MKTKVVQHVPRINLSYFKFQIFKFFQIFNFFQIFKFFQILKFSLVPSFCLTFRHFFTGKYRLAFSSPPWWGYMLITSLDVVRYLIMSAVPHGALFSVLKTNIISQLGLLGKSQMSLNNIMQIRLKIDFSLHDYGQLKKIWSLQIWTNL